MLQRSVVVKGCRECRELSQKSVVDKRWGELLEKSVGKECCRDVL